MTNRTDDSRAAEEWRGPTLAVAPFVARAVERLRLDGGATVVEQVSWLGEAGFEDAGCFFRAFRFAVFGGWKPGAGSGAG